MEEWKNLVRFESLSQAGNDPNTDSILLNFLGADGNFHRIAISAACAEGVATAIMAQMSKLDEFSPDPRRRASKTVECHKVTSGVRDDYLPFMEFTLETETPIQMAFTREGTQELFRAIFNLKLSVPAIPLPPPSHNKGLNVDQEPDFPLQRRWFDEVFPPDGGIPIYQFDLSDHRSPNVKAISYRYEKIILDYSKKFGDSFEIAHGFLDTGNIDAFATLWPRPPREEGSSHLT